MTTASAKRFIVGIDLGTTNSAVAYVDLEAASGGKRKVRMFRVPQLTGEAEVSHQDVLPSFLYIPGKYEIDLANVKLPWATEEDAFVGVYARDYGAKIPSRLVSSAKSWLCHFHVDRHARILPRGSGDEVYKVSPVQATAAYLRHIRRSWNQSRGDEEELFLENQNVVLTVPASFDEAARALTVEAAAMAGLPGVTLLEEPLAAFYAWMIVHEQDWDRHVTPGDLILVCDVGGGTTDFTLITLRETDGSPRFERIAVGDHLILGGDNMDLAIARSIEQGFGGKGARLTGDQWKTLCHQCRQAKERILSGATDREIVTVMGAGSRLISGAMSARLDRSALERTILDGFFPAVEAEEPRQQADRKGIVEFGLPYEQEPAVTRHLGWFLERHRDEVRELLGKTPLPDHVLFNGGALMPPAVQEKIRGAMHRWFHAEDVSGPVILENPRPDLAVAFGAAYYGLVKIGLGVRVGSGSSRSYYLGVAAGPEAGGEPTHAICLVERGLDEGSAIALADRRFDVRTNEPVGFDVFSSSFRNRDRCGDVIAVDDSLTRLPPIRTIVQFGKSHEKTLIPAGIEAEYTEMGTLALWCRSLVSSHRWRLEFQLRSEQAAAVVSDREVLEASVLEDACRIVRETFEQAVGEQQLAKLTGRIQDITGRPREKWPLSFIRKLADTLLEIAELRRRSSAHESRWLNLTGFCLRPGFGDGFDEHRIKRLWKIYPAGPVFEKNPQVRIDWWVLWRRVAGGLNPGQQRQVLQDVMPVIIPRKGAKPVKTAPQELIEIWMALANMERLLVKDKIRCGRQLIEELGPKKTKSQHLWTLARLGARHLLYGSTDRVIPPGEAASWIGELMKHEWKRPDPVIHAVIRMGRKTGDRIRDMESAAVEEIVQWLRIVADEAFPVDAVTTVIPLAREEENDVFGEALPAGLIIKADTVP